MKKLLVLTLITSFLRSYDLPVTMNLGYSNILEGGPIRPTNGLYWYQYFNYYAAHNFMDGCGNPINKNKLNRLDIFFGGTEFIYQTEKNYFLNAKCGIDFVLYYCLYSKLKGKIEGITTSGAGIADPYLGIFLQWDPISNAERAIFVHRLEFAASFPSGKYSSNYLFSPGSGFYFINPNWAATLFLTPSLAFSTHLNYYWSAKNKHNNTQAGQAISFNYSAEYEIIKNTWIAVNGYYLNQFTNSKINGISAPGRKERAFSIGPGILYSPSDDFFAIANLYFESQVKNRPQGISFLLRSVVHF